MESLSKKGESPFLRVRVPRQTLEALRRIAKRDRRTVSDWVRLALEDALKKGERK